MSVNAGTVVTIVRDLIPDPVYDATNTAQPAQDGGLFKAQTLYRWLNDGVKALAQQLGWVVDDWTALTVTANVPTYSLDSKWHQIEACYQNAYQLLLAPETMTLWPKPVTGAQCAYFVPHKVTDHFELGLFPVVSVSDPTTTLNMGGGLSSTATSATLTSVTGLLPYGYLQIDSEIVFYGAISGSAVTPLLRGQCGTTAASHLNAATVTHLSVWVKGKRMPNEIATSTDTVELPAGFIYCVQEYMLAKANIAQEDLQAGQAHMKAFQQEAARIYADPNWRTDAQGTSVQPYGYPLLGNLAWGNVYVP